MLGLISGETVVVIWRETVYDHLSEPVETIETREEVAGVVVAPGTTTDLDASRPKGVEVDFTLCFPKTFTGELRGCAVDVRGVEYEVVGNPQRYMEANTPGEWNLTVEVRRVDG